MLVTILLIYLGSQIGVPTAYYCLCGLLLVIQVVRYGTQLYKQGKKDGIENGSDS